ncbi:MAG TPA: Holliday junction resolvase RuvX [Pyrinomonadaceae bacterium]
MQEEETINPPDFSEISHGRILALDLGTKWVGIAVCDELQITVRPVCVIERRSWKELLRKISAFIVEFDAVALVLGLPYNFDGSESEMSIEARRLHRNFSLSLKIPVYFQDERLTSMAADKYLREQRLDEKQIRRNIDSTAAAFILNDFLAKRQNRLRQRADEPD